MRNVLLAGAAAVAFAGAAQASVITQWVMFGQPGDQAFTAASANATGVSGMNMARGAGLTPTAANHSISASGWDDMSANDYFTFGFTVDAGFSVDLTSLTIATRSSNTGPGFLGLFYSGDGFSSNLHTFTNVGTAFTNSIVNLSSLTGLTGSVEFRVMSLNTVSANGGTVGSAGTMRISEYFDGSDFHAVHFSGSVIPTPGAVALFGLAGLAGLRRRR